MIFQLLLPLFILSALGTILAKSGWLRPAGQAGLAELTGRVLIPALLFQGSYENGLPGAQTWTLLGAFFLPLVAVFLLFARHADRALGASYGNGAFVGIPVVTQALGASALHYLFPIIAFHGLIAFTLYYAAAHAGGKLWASVKAALANPLVFSLMAGLACNLLGVHLPQPAAKAINLLASATMPCALVSLGASLAAFHFGHIAIATRIAAAKVLLLPAIVWAVTTYAVQLPTEARLVLILLAACPVGINAGVVVSANKEDTAAVNAATLLSSIACCISIPLWLTFATRTG